MKKNLEKSDLKGEETTSVASVSQSTLPGSEGGFFDAEFLQQISAKKAAQEHIDDYVKAKISEYAAELDIESDFEYILRYFFDQWSRDEVDVEYVLQVGAGVARYEAELIQKVNHYTQTFKYDQMDVLDQACLLLGYLEYKIWGSSKDLVINEMVEFAKRYSDDGSPKLINGILHQLFLDEEAAN